MCALAPGGKERRTQAGPESQEISLEGRTDGYEEGVRCFLETIRRSSCCCPIEADTPVAPRPPQVVFYISEA